MKKKIFQKTILSNGFTVISDRVANVRSVAVGLWIPIGSRDEIEECNGITHFLEHLVFKGTRTRDYIKILQSLERLGGYLNAFTSKEHTCFYAHLLGEYLPSAIDVLSDLVFRPSFPDNEFGKEKNVIIEEIKEVEDTPDDLIYDAFDAQIYRDHPLGLPVLGKAEILKKLTVDVIKQYAKEGYSQSGMILAVAGNVQHDRLVKLVERYVPKRRRPVKKAKRMVFSERMYKPKFVSLNKLTIQAHAIVGLPFDRHDESYFPTLLLNTILGEGMSSRLNIELREKKGLVYNVGSSLSFYEDSSSIVSYLGTDSKSLSLALKLVAKEFKKMREKKISARELALAKKIHRGSILMGEESMTTRMNTLFRNEDYFKRRVTSEESIDMIESVTSDQVFKVAQHVLKEDDISTLIFLPEK